MLDTSKNFASLI